MKHAFERKGFCRGLAGSLIIAASVGAPLQGAHADEAFKKVNASKQERSVITIKAAASRGEPEAMYKLAMLHIEGNIQNADYDTGVRLLKRSAAKGNRDAQRMYAFMDNAFSGEGC